MHRIVANCFKSIAFAILFIVIWDVAFYLWRANALNDRMESIAVSMQEVISKNNYLPGDLIKKEGDVYMFYQMFRNMANDMNVNGNVFINGFNWNYNHNSDYAPVIKDDKGKNIVKRRMSEPASYGDIMVVEIEVGINATVWGKSAFNANTGAAGQFNHSDYATKFTYTYLVPCLKYTTITSKDV